MEIVNIILICSILSGIIVLLIKVCFASKCEDVNICFGLISVKRNVQLEKKTISKLNSSDLELELELDKITNTNTNTDKIINKKISKIEECVNQKSFDDDNLGID